MRDKKVTKARELWEKEIKFDRTQELEEGTEKEREN